MRKTILITLFALFSVAIMAQSTFKHGVKTPTLILGEDTVRVEMLDGYVTDGNFEKLFDKYTEKTAEGINSFLKSVQENFTDEAEFVWDSYIKRYQLNFYIALLIAGLGVFLFLCSLIMYWVTDWDMDEGPGVLTVVGLIVFLGGAIATVACLPYLLTPEYYVLQDLLGILK